MPRDEQVFSMRGQLISFLDFMAWYVLSVWSYSVVAQCIVQLVSFLDSMAWYVLSVWSYSAVAPMHKQKNVTCSNNSLLVNVEI